MSAVLDLAPLFRRAAEVIETNGHCKNWFHDTYAIELPLRKRRVCAVGALCVADGLPPDELSALAELEAVEFLSRRIDSNVVDEDPVERIADWNDAPARTEAEVIEALRDAAAAAEAVAA